MKHGMSRTRFYRIWNAMVRRCFNKNQKNYIKYGANGISISKKWRIFENFKNDMLEDYMIHAKKHGEKETTLDRIDNKKNYSKKNCRWATYKEQANNKTTNRTITYKNKTMSVTRWSEITGIARQTICWRIDHNWDIDKIFIKKDFRL